MEKSVQELAEFLHGTVDLHLTEMQTVVSLWMRMERKCMEIIFSMFVVNISKNAENYRTIRLLRR